MTVFPLSVRGSFFRPRIRQRYSAIYEVSKVARGEARTARSGDTCDLRVELADLLAACFARSGNVGMCVSRVGVERQYSPGEILIEHGLGSFAQAIAALARGQQREAVMDFRPG